LIYIYCGFEFYTHRIKRVAGYSSGTGMGPWLLLQVLGAGVWALATDRFSE